MAMKRTREIYMTHILIIIAAKLTGVLLINSILSQFHNDCSSFSINAIVNNIRDLRRCPIKNKLPNSDGKENISKETNLK